MAGFDRVNGYLNNYVTGTLFSVAQLKAFVVVLKNDSNTAITLTAEDGDTADTDADQLVELVIKEVQPLMYLSPTAVAGTIYIIVDGHAVDADTLQARIRAVVAGYQGHAAADNDSTVTLGTAITVS